MVPSHSEIQNVLNILSKLGEKPLDTRNYLEILYELAVALERTGATEEAMDLYGTCLKTAQKQNISPRIALLSALHLTNIFGKQAQWNRVQHYYKIARDLMDKLSPETRLKYHAYSVLTMASHYVRSGQLEKAYRILNSTISGFRASLNSFVTLGHLLSNYGTTLSFMDRNKEAVRAFSEALQYLQESPEPYVLTLGNLALSYVEYGNYELAYLNLEKAQKYVETHTLKYAEGYIQMDWGIYWTAVEEYKKAIHALERSIEILKENQDMYGLYFAKKELALAIGKSGERGKAEKILRDVIYSCETYGLKLQKLGALEALAEVLNDPSFLEEAEKLSRELGNPTHADRIRERRDRMIKN